LPVTENVSEPWSVVIETSCGAGIQNARSPFTFTSTSASNRSTDLLTNSWSPCATINIRPQSVPSILG